MADMQWTRDGTYNAILSQVVLYDLIIEGNWIKLWVLFSKAEQKMQIYCYRKLSSSFRK